MNSFFNIFIKILFLIFIHHSLYSADVNFHAWGGSVIINDFIKQASKDLKKKNINLNHTKITDIAESIKILETDKKINNLQKGSIDLMWVNGENFHRLKKNQLLFGPIDTIDNYKYISVTTSETIIKMI